MTSTATDQSITEQLDPKVWKTASVVFLGPLLTQMSSTVVNLSLSTILDELHASIDSLQWIISGYLLSLALALPLNAWLVGRLGARRLYIWCFSGFTLASLLCGMQKSIEGLILARVIQGIAGGLLTPMAQMMLARAAGRHLSRVIGYIAMPILIAPLLGPVVAGLILKYAGWPWLFYMNLPFGVLAVLLAMHLLPGEETPGASHRFDFSAFVFAITWNCRRSLWLGSRRATRRKAFSYPGRDPDW